LAKKFLVKTKRFAAFARLKNKKSAGGKYGTAKANDTPKNEKFLVFCFCRVLFLFFYGASVKPLDFARDFFCFCLCCIVIFPRSFGFAA
jgi:hypothetical protein